MAFAEAIRSSRRINFVLILMGTILALVIFRLVQVQVVHSADYKQKAISQQSHKFEIPAKRGEIYVADQSDLYPVALNQSLKLMYADPKFIADPGKAAEQLASITGLDEAKLKKDLTYDGNRYIELKQKVSREEADKINDLKIAGIVLKDKDYRFYTEGDMLSHVLGYVNVDGQGQYGIEQYLNDDLTGKTGLLRSVTDSQGVPIVSSANTIVEPQNGQSIVLTIDRSIQTIAQKALKEAVEKNQAESGSIIVMEPDSGAIKALVNYPTYDPNAYGQVKPDDYKVFINSAVSNQYEPGSGFKAITMAAGIDSGKVQANTKFTDTGMVKIDDREVFNANKKSYGATDMAGVIKNSINTGVVFVLKSMGGDIENINRAGRTLFYNYIKKFGFGVKTGVEQAFEAEGNVKPPTAPSVDYANMTFGQGIGVTSMQMIQAVAAVANGGKLIQPRLVDKVIDKDNNTKKIEPKIINDRVISPQAAATVANMMIAVVEQGSGHAAQMKGYKVAGKTGTAQVPRPDGKGYEESKNIGSFVGFAPASNPKFIMLVRIDYPKNVSFAELTAVPAFGTVARELVKYYQIPPSGK